MSTLAALGALLGCGGGSNTPATSSGSSSSSSGALDAGSLHAITLSGCPLSSYFAPVAVGGQTFTTIVDTGSTDLAVALSTCSTCDVSPKLLPPAGSCSTQLGTQRSLGWVGGVCSESVSVGGELPDVTMKVVGISDNVSFFTNVDCTQQTLSSGQPMYQGILGLGPPPLDTIGHAANDAYFTQLVAGGVADKFALLLCSVGGRAWFGGYDPAFASGAPRYTPLSMPEGWTIAVSSIGLGSTSLGPGSPESILDTGTQFYSMPHAAYEALMRQASPSFTTIFGSSTLGAVFGQKPCVLPASGQTQAEVDEALPPMTMTLPAVGGGSFTLSLPATSSYLVPATTAGGGATQYCLAIKDSASTHDLSILGGPMLRGYITLFDLAGSQIGFIPQSFCH